MLDSYFQSFFEGRGQEKDTKDNLPSKNYIYKKLHFGNKKLQHFGSKNYMLILFIVLFTCIFSKICHTLNHTLKGFGAGNLLAHIPVVILVALLCTLSKLSLSFSR